MVFRRCRLSKYASWIRPILFSLCLGLIFVFLRFTLETGKLRLNFFPSRFIRNRSDQEARDRVRSKSIGIDRSIFLDRPNRDRLLQNQADEDDDSKWADIDPTRKLNLPSLLYTLNKKAKIRLVLLDPLHIRTDPVIFNQSLHAVDSRPYFLSTFGLFERDRDAFERFFDDRISAALTDSDYRLITARGLDYRRMTNRRATTRFVETTTHYFLVPRRITNESSAIVHIPVIFPRINFKWISDLRESTISPSKYRFLQHQERMNYSIPMGMAFETFECDIRRIRLTDQLAMDFCQSNDPDFYLWQLPMSGFRECHFNDVVYPFRSNFPLMGLANDTTNQSIALTEIMRVSKLTRAPTFITCGTLLGWYRQCDYIVESKDVDVAMKIEDYSYRFYKTLFQSPMLNLIIRLGTLDTGLEFRTYARKGGVWLDVFFLYPNEARTRSAFMWYNRNWYETVSPNPRGLCSAELFGVLVYIPCNYHEWVVADYGPDGWFPPNRSGGYSNKNMHWRKKYDETDVAYMEYKYVKGGCEKPDELWGCDEAPAEVINSTLYSDYLEKKQKDGKVVVDLPEA